MQVLICIQVLCNATTTTTINYTIWDLILLNATATTEYAILDLLLLNADTYVSTKQGERGEAKLSTRQTRLETR